MSNVCFCGDLEPSPTLDTFHSAGFRSGVQLSGRQSPKCARFIGARANEREVCGMPPARDDFVVVSGHADGGQRLAEVSLQVRQDEPVVVASAQKVVGVRREPHRSDILRWVISR